MKKILLICFIIVSTIFFANEFKKIKTVLLLYRVPEKRATELTQAIISECQKFNIPTRIILGLLIAESAGKNVLGDNGDAVGYFQLHKETVWFVSSYFQEFKKYNRDHKQLIYFPIDQVKIAVRYIYLIKSNDLKEIITRWNGKSRYEYYAYIIGYVNYLMGLVN